MKWFEGSINNAVATSKAQKAIFVVFVEGKDEASAQLSQAINAPEVSARLEQDDFVAIRLESGSEAYRFFAQIYHLVPVPCLFFIGESGTPLEIVAGSTNASDLLKKIEGVFVKAKKNYSSSQNLLNSEQNAAAAGVSVDKDNSNNATSKEESTAASSKANTEPVIKAEEQEVIPDDENQTKDDSREETKLDDPATSAKESSVEEKETKEESMASELTPEEKLERVKQLIELQRKQRVEEEEKKERERELERRKTGRDVQKMKRRQQELEIKQAHDERMKEKADEAAAREKIKRQIEQDKLERKQRDLAMQEMQKQQTSEPVRPRSPAPADATVTRIQFRLPSGNPHMGQFDPNSTLGALRTYVVENIDLPFRQFSMSTSFPRRDLTHEDNEKTLLDLELVPTAVILILPLKNATITTTVTSTQDVGFLSRFIWSLFVPFIGVYNYLVNYFSRGTQKNTRERHNDRNEPTEAASSADGAVPANLQNIANSGLLRRYLGSQGGTKIRAEGNIHRLHSGGDDNDENNTWNGNSTQQM